RYPGFIRRRFSPGGKEATEESTDGKKKRSEGERPPEIQDGHGAAITDQSLAAAPGPGDDRPAAAGIGGLLLAGPGEPLSTRPPRVAGGLEPRRGAKRRGQGRGRGGGIRLVESGPGGLLDSPVAVGPGLAVAPPGTGRAGLAPGGRLSGDDPVYGWASLSGPPLFFRERWTDARR